MSAAAFSHMTEGGQLLVWGVRHWMVATLQGRCVPLSVQRSFETVGGPRAYPSLTAFVLLVARDADRPLAINPPCCQELSADEENIARVLTALTRDSSVAALRQLRVLLGAEPSAALQRCASAVAERFKAVGLMVGVSDGDRRACDADPVFHPPAEDYRDR
jgi:hypothetical protein